MKTYSERIVEVTGKIREIRRRRVQKRLSITVATAAVLTLVLFFPLNVEPPNVRAYSDSPYYELIKEIDRANGGEPGYKNLFTAITYKISELTLHSKENTSVETPVEPPVEDNPDIGDDDPYVNLNFEDDTLPGMTEGNVVLSTEECIYRLDHNILKVFSRDGEESKKICEYRISAKMLYVDGKYEKYESFYSGTEMFFSADGTKITVMIPVVVKEGGRREYTMLVQLDVSDPMNIRQIERYYVSGYPLDAWMVEDELLIVTEYEAGMVLDYSKIDTYVPTIGYAQQLQPIPAEDIVLTGADLTKLQYIILYKVDMAELQVKDQLAVMSRGWYDGLYISEEYLFTAYVIFETIENPYMYNIEGDIACFRYRDGLELVRSTTLSGEVGGDGRRLHMDLHNGVLRLITRQDVNYGSVYSLYCLDMPKLGVISKTENITPNGRPGGVEFKGDSLYLVNNENASNRQTPYIYDLSNPKKITYEPGSEKIAMKDKLLKWTDGYWLGISKTENEYQMVLELFKETDAGLSSVDKYAIDAMFVSGKDALYVDPERGLLGFYVRYKLKDNLMNSSWFLLLEYTDGHWREHSCIAAGNHRMLPQDDWIYLISNNVIKAIPLS